MLGAVLVAAVVAWAFVTAAPYLAGEDTRVSFMVDIAVRFTRNLHWFVVALALLVALYWRRAARREQRVRHDNIERLAPDHKERQLQRDPNRESCGLTKRGRTPEDDP